MTNFNERTNTLLYKNIISHTLFSKGLMLVVCERWAGDGDRLQYWPSSTSFSSWLGYSTVGHWGPKALCLPLALNSASCLQLARTASGTWLHNCLTTTCFRCSSAYLHRFISWLTARSRVNMLQDVILKKSVWFGRDDRSMRHPVRIEFRNNGLLAELGNLYSM